MNFAMTAFYESTREYLDLKLGRVSAKTNCSTIIRPTDLVNANSINELNALKLEVEDLITDNFEFGQYYPLP